MVEHAAGSAYEPKNYEDAVTCADASKWILSMDEEVEEVIANQVWESWDAFRSIDSHWKICV